MESNHQVIADAEAFYVVLTAFGLWPVNKNDKTFYTWLYPIELQTDLHQFEGTWTLNKCSPIGILLAMIIITSKWLDFWN